MGSVLTEATVAAMKPRPGVQVEAPDQKVRGLVLRVSPGGTKTWFIRYRGANGQRRRAKLGTYPVFSLADARLRALKMLALIEDDHDPIEEKRQAQITGASLNELAAEFWSAATKGLHGGRGRPLRPKTIALMRQRYECHASPLVGERPYAQLRRGDMRALQRQLIEKGLSPSSVSGVIGAVRSILGLAYYEERIAANPAAGLIRAMALPSRERHWTADQARRLYAYFAGATCELEPSMKLLLRFLALTLLRRDEARLATWDEVDLETRVLIIPKERSKSGRTHLTPLSTEALKLLAEARTESGGSGYIFPSRLVSDRTREREPLNKDAPYIALSRTCRRLEIPHGGLHDWRRTGATLMTGEAMSIRRFIVSLVLGHNAQEGAAVTSIYDRNDYLADKRQALEAWGAFISECAPEGRPKLRLVASR